MRYVYRSVLISAMSILLVTCSTSKIFKDTFNPEVGKPYDRATKSDSLLGMLTSYRTCYDVNFYDLDIKLVPEKKWIEGSEKIYSTTTFDFDTFQVDLHKNMKIDSILLNDNEQLKYYRVENSVFVIMPQTSIQGEKFFINVFYRGNPIVAPNPPWEGGFVWKKDKNNKPWIGVAVEGDGSGMWRPDKDHNYDEPDSAAVNITVERSLVGVSNGVLRETVNNSDSTTTYKWFTSYPINGYNITVYAGDFLMFDDTFHSISGNTVKLTYYVLSYDLEKAKTQFEQVKPILHFYEDVFGEYPWQKDGYKLIDSPFEGMEHQSAIAYGAGFKNLFEGGWDYIILHESAHEWWGNSLTAFDLAEGWLHEGFATYAEWLYVEKFFPGSERILRTLERNQIKNLRPVVGPGGRKFFYQPKVDSDIYMKGAWVIYSLRAYLDDDSLFFDILKSFAIKYRMRIVTTQDFIDLVNEKSGRDMKWFFDQYLYSRFVPVLEICPVREGLYYRWTKTNSDFKIPVKVKLSGDREVEINPTSKTQLYRASLTGVSIKLDQFLFLVKTNEALPVLFRRDGN